MAKANHNPAAPAETVPSVPAAPAETAPSVQDNAGVDAPASVASSEGVRARRAFMLKHLIPHQDWINTNIVAKGKGTKALIGRVFGVCMGDDRQEKYLARWNDRRECRHERSFSG